MTAGRRAKFIAKFLDLFERYVALGVSQNHRWIKRQGAGDHIDQCLLRAFWMIEDMCPTKDETTLIGQDQEMNEFMPLGVIRSNLVCASAIDKRDVGEVPWLRVHTFERDSQHLAL